MCFRRDCRWAVLQATAAACCHHLSVFDKNRESALQCALGVSLFKYTGENVNAHASRVLIDDFQDDFEVFTSDLFWHDFSFLWHANIVSRHYRAIIAPNKVARNTFVSNSFTI